MAYTMLANPRCSQHQMPTRSDKDQNLIVTNPPPRGHRTKMPLASFTFLRGHARAERLHVRPEFRFTLRKIRLTLLSWLIYISIRFMLRPTTTYTARTTGSFVVPFFPLASLFRLSWKLRSRSDGRIFANMRTSI